MSAPTEKSSLAETVAKIKKEEKARRAGHEPLPEEIRYIAIEGVIGVGKTTLTRLLAERFDAQLVLEQFEENPFLASFYADPERWAFHTQLSFLASRFRQQKALAARDLFHQVTISDYTFDKDRIFAHINLQGDEMHLYESLYGLMETATPAPDLVIYLQSTATRLLQNIAQRGRPYERDMSPTYIQQLAEAYDAYFFHYTKSPLLIVNATHIDFVKHQADFEELVRQIVRGAHAGTTYFNPNPSAAPLLDTPSDTPVDS